MKRFLFLYILAIFFYSCQKHNEVSYNEPKNLSEGFLSLEVPNNFNFEAYRKVTLNINFAYDVQHTTVGIYADSSFSSGSYLGEIVLKKNTTYTTTVSLPEKYKRLYTKSSSFGTPMCHEFDIRANTSYLTLNEHHKINDPIETSSSSRNANTNTFNFNGIITASKGSYDSLGVPHYLTTPDTIHQDLMDDINSYLPNEVSVLEHSPHLITNGSSDITFDGPCDLWITFVHEGAGWKNSLCYYTYDIRNPPSSTADIDSLHILFPNITYSGVDGGLHQGDKIFIGSYNATTAIGFALIPNGWQSYNQQVGNKPNIKFSNSTFNTFTDQNNRQHMVTIWDEQRDIMFLGIEDWSRPSGDKDFNDLLFYLTPEAQENGVNTAEMSLLTEVEDSDNDGSPDHMDQYPNDPNKAYHSYIQLEDDYFNYSFEDLWPEKGDYDFNDLVVGVKYKKILDSNYNLKQIEMEGKLFCIGGYRHNGFGVELPFNNTLVESVTGQILDQNIVVLNANGTESGNNNATIILFEDAYSLMQSVDDDDLVNVRPFSTYIEPYEFNVVVTFTSGALENSDFVDLPNAFIFIDGDRGRELHLPGYTPTSKVNEDYFKQGDDNTDPSKNNFYKTTNNHPWGIVVVAPEFEYPKEESDITKVFNHFRSWVESGGNSYPNWFDDENGYRKSDEVYQEIKRIND
ncbi:LruC domain-containing protein [Flammeovirga pacifica]|uniref:DUF4842 domain-containing protein n=1 Tax=Flammeovirga pacifica TaxID=915059 RepID=A0A1S1YT78_FLAPC|nr:LruC domain-containing protein [Flammeovirga pacifica]OHX64230.1 hypothetical protein NH26_21745 [Flammeovirga pacifica]